MRTDERVAAGTVDADFDDLLLFLRENRGVDFSSYKRTSLERLVERRRLAAGAEHVRGYLDRLLVDPAEVTRLFDGLLINVTSFFRDPPAWSSLASTLVPSMLAVLPDDEPLRVWSAACATGEEAYSLAMLFHGLLGDEAFRARVKVYATDIDEPALAVARTGHYPAARLSELSAEQRETYFTGPDRTVFRSDLRQNIIFGRHDLLADAPISRVSLLTCRNALMYFNAEAQSRILERFAFALHEQGLLMLGRPEMLLTYNDLFNPIDLPHRIFRANRRPAPVRFRGYGPAAQAREATLRRLVGAAFVGGSEAELVLDAEQVVVLVNDAAIARLGVAQDDVGRAFAELDLSFRPVEPRGLVNDALRESTYGSFTGVPWPGRTGADRYWDVHVTPLGGEPEPLGVQISFLDVTRLRTAEHGLADAAQERQRTLFDLQSSTEDLETTNEELQSAIEELETTNEELQSTNEELETMNEELQGTNEELQTVNDELRERTGEIGEVNAFLESILSGLRNAIIVVDAEHKVLVWNAGAERLWGLRAYEVEGELLSELSGLVPRENLATCLSAVLSTGRSCPADTLLMTIRTGEQLLITLTGAPLHDRIGQVRGAILTMDDHQASD